MILLAAGACGHRGTTIRVEIPDLDGRLTPVARLAIVVLPYDRDSLLAALEAAAPGPRPDTAALDSLFAVVRAPFNDLLRAESHATAVRDSLARLRDRLEREPPEQCRVSQRLPGLHGTGRLAGPRRAADREGPGRPLRSRAPGRAEAGPAADGGDPVGR